MDDTALVPCWFADDESPLVATVAVTDAAVVGVVVGKAVEETEAGTAAAEAVVAVEFAAVGCDGATVPWLIEEKAGGSPKV